MAISPAIRSSLLVVAVAAALLTTQTLFIVGQTEQVLVNRLGEVVRTEKEPGLFIKVPFIDKLTRYDNRVLGVTFDPREVVIKGDEKDDTKRMIIDAYAKYRITDPLKFYKSVGNEVRLKDRLSPLFENGMRREVGKMRLKDILSERRTDVMDSIERAVNKNAEEAGLGIEVVDVRIIRADLPQKNSRAVYERMIAQHEKEARQIRAEGEEAALRIRSEADKTVRVTMAQAQKEADIIRGKADAEATKIYADAYSVDPEFYGFYRTMAAYRAALTNADNPMRIVISPDNEFFSYLQHNKAVNPAQAERRRLQGQ